MIFHSQPVTIALLLQEIRNVTVAFGALRDQLERSEVRLLCKDLDCWHSNARTHVENKSFKDALIEFYESAVGDQVKCMATGRAYAPHEVRASHIIKRSTNGDTMGLYGLPPDIDNPRNGLLLLEPIEVAFDRKDICILHNPITGKLTMKVLNPQLKTEVMKGGQNESFKYGKYELIDGAVLQLPNDKFPYRRVLSMHAKFAFSRALHLGWISDTEVLDSYFNVSDTGLQEPLGLADLTWQQVHSEIHIPKLNRDLVVQSSKEQS